VVVGEAVVEILEEGAVMVAEEVVAVAVAAPTLEPP